MFNNEVSQCLSDMVATNTQLIIENSNHFQGSLPRTECMRCETVELFAFCIICLIGKPQVCVSDIYSPQMARQTDILKDLPAYGGQCSLSCRLGHITRGPRTCAQTLSRNVGQLLSLCLRTPQPSSYAPWSVSTVKVCVCVWGGGGGGG